MVSILQPDNSYVKKLLKCCNLMNFLLDLTILKFHLKLSTSSTQFLIKYMFSFISAIKIGYQKTPYFEIGSRQVSGLTPDRAMDALCFIQRSRSCHELREPANGQRF